MKAFLIAFFGFSSLFMGSVAHGFYSNSGVEADVSFEADYQMEGAQPSQADALGELRNLIYYMAGPLQQSSPIAGPKFDHRLRVLSITPAQGGWRVRYQFSGTFVIEAKKFQNFKIFLPKSAKNIYRQAYNPSGWSPFTRHPCIEAQLEEYLSEKYFWYFWNPQKSGCRLKAGEHYDVITPKVSLKNNFSNQSFPEYERLPNPAGDLDIMIFFGVDQDKNGLKSPESSGDVNAPNFRQIARSLSRQGFNQRRWNSQDFQTFCSTNKPLDQTIDEFSRQDGPRKITVRVLWGMTSLRPEALPFYCLLNHAVSRSSVTIYNGHSGLGASLFLTQLKQQYPYPFQLNKSQYQILAFNGCSSYGYYNIDFFRDKATSSDPEGTKNLEVITNGIAGSFGDLGDMTLSILNAVLDWSKSGEKTSYQKIIDRMGTSYLTSVNGDEDNP